MKMSQGKIESLPKWAQSRIRYLERQLASNEEAFRQIEGESDICWEYGTGECGGIPEDATVVFKTNTGIIRAQLVRGSLHITSYIYYISVLPEAANSIEVLVDERR